MESHKTDDSEHDAAAKTPIATPASAAKSDRSDEKNEGHASARHDPKADGKRDIKREDPQHEASGARRTDGASDEDAEAKETARLRGEKSARKPKLVKNNVRKMRTDKMISKAELARRAGMSTLTIDRVERGLPCRMDTKRKILEALGLKPSDRVAVFGEDD